MIIKRKLFSNKKKNKKNSTLNVVGNLGIAGSLYAGGSALGNHMVQNMLVSKLTNSKTGSKAHKEAMERINEAAKKASFKDIKKGAEKASEYVAKNSNGDFFKKLGGELKVNETKLALEAAKNKSLHKKVALVAGGIGVGAKLLAKTNKKDSSNKKK